MHVLALGDQLAELRDDHTGGTRRGAADKNLIINFDHLAVVELRDEETECLLLKSSLGLYTTGGIS